MVWCFQIKVEKAGLLSCGAIQNGVEMLRALTSA
jgi:hypothetical protein